MGKGRTVHVTEVCREGVHTCRPGLKGANIFVLKGQTSYKSKEGIFDSFQNKHNCTSKSSTVRSHEIWDSVGYPSPGYTAFHTKGHFSNIERGTHQY